MICHNFPSRLQRCHRKYEYAEGFVTEDLSRYVKSDKKNDIVLKYRLASLLV